MPLCDMWLHSIQTSPFKHSFLNEFTSFLRGFTQVLGCQVSQSLWELYVGKLLAMSLLLVGVTWSAWYPGPQDTIGLCCPKWWPCEATENLVLKAEKNTADVDTQCCSSLVLYADRVEWTVFEYAGLNEYITELKLPYLFFLLFLLILLLLLTLVWFIETGSLVAEDGLKLIIKLKMTWVPKPVCLVYVVLETNPRLWGC